MRLLLLLWLRRILHREQPPTDTTPRYEAQFNHRKRTQSD